MDKQEIVFELSRGEWHISLLISLSAMLLILILVRLYIYFKTKNNSKRVNKFGIVLFSIITIIIIFYIGIYLITVFHFVVEYNIVKTSTVIIIDYNDYNAGRELISNDSHKYNLYNTNEELGDYIEETFVGQTCEIEYYRIIKVVKRITLVEQ